MELRKFKMAQMIDFFTKPLFKNAQKQSHKGGSLEARKPLNNNECFTTLNKVSGFLVLQILVVEFFSQFPFQSNSCIYY